MVSITGIYQGDLRTEMTHLKSGIKVITDAPPDNNGKGEAFSPTDLTCASLNSCMMTLMGILGSAGRNRAKRTPFRNCKNHGF
jgi:putative redox protein